MQVITFASGASTTVERDDAGQVVLVHRDVDVGVEVRENYSPSEAVSLAEWILDVAHSLKTDRDRVAVAPAPAPKLPGPGESR